MGSIPAHRNMKADPTLVLNAANKRLTNLLDGVLPSACTASAQSDCISDWKLETGNWKLNSKLQHTRAVASTDAPPDSFVSDTPARGERGLRLQGERSRKARSRIERRRVHLTRARVPRRYLPPSTDAGDRPRHSQVRRPARELLATGGDG